MSLEMGIFNIFRNKPKLLCIKKKDLREKLDV